MTSRGHNFGEFLVAAKRRRVSGSVASGAGKGWLAHSGEGQQLGPPGLQTRTAARLRGGEPVGVVRDLGRCLGNGHPGGDLWADPGHAEGITSLGWLGNGRGEECLGFLAKTAAPATHTRTGG